MHFLPLIAAVLAALAQTASQPRLGGFQESSSARPATTFLALRADGELLTAEQDLPGHRPRPMLEGEARGVAVAPDGTVYVAWSGADQLGILRAGDGRVRESIHAGRGTGVGDLRAPGGVALDLREPLRVLVADTLNHRIAIFGADGAPLGSLGTRGTGEGELDHPADVAVDARGHVFVADLGNDRIVEFGADGSFVASFGGRGFHPGLFAAPAGIDVHAGQIFVADRDNHRIQVFGLDGRFAYGFGLHALLPRQGQGRLHFPDDVAVSPTGREAFVLEELEDRIQVFGPRGDAESAPAGERDSAAHYAGFCSVRGDVIALIEPSGPAVVIFDLTREVPIEITRFGRFGRGPGQMVRPSSVLFDATGDIVYVADPFAGRISSYSIERARDEALRFDPKLARLVRSVDLASVMLPGEGSALPPRERGAPLPLRGESDSKRAEPVPPGAWTIEPQGMALGKEGRILVADVANRCIVELGADLSGPLRVIATPIDPVGIAFDALTGRTFVTDPIRREVAVIAADGTVVRRIAVPDGRPFGIAVAPDGTVWVGDRRRGRLAKLVDDEFLTVVDGAASAADGGGSENGGARGSGTRAGAGGAEIAGADGSARAGRGELFQPEGVACDERGRVFVVEAGNHRCQVFDPDGKYVAMFGARFYTEAARTPPPDVEARPWSATRSLVTNGGTWRVLWRARPANVPRGEAFAIDAWVFARGDASRPAEGLDLRVDAWMPDHLHGMNRVPALTRREDGGFTASGLLFHMPGAWEIHFDVVSGAVTERAQARVDLE